MSRIDDAAAPERLASADPRPRTSPHPGPADWRDQVLYFLLTDRFSDGREATRRRFNRAKPGEFLAHDKAAWMAAGTQFQGGTLRGVRSKLPYLRGLGVTTVWLGPVWDVGADDIDPRLGTGRDLRDLVDAAHDAGMFVVLDDGFGPIDACAGDDALTDCLGIYQHWLAASDCDGLRVGAARQASFEAARNFCGALHEYAESLGKHNFLLVGDAAGGGGHADPCGDPCDDVLGRNLDAAADVGEPTRRLALFAKGIADPAWFFEQFAAHDARLGSHRESARRRVSLLDAHEAAGRWTDERFCARNNIPDRYQQAALAVGVQLTTLGIPCVYYGTEQAFDGGASDHDDAFEPRDHAGRVPGADRYVRECMFGGTFGAFETAGCHFFDPGHPTYLRIAAVANVRRRADAVGLTLRRGRQYPRETSREAGRGRWRIPRRGELAAWSRIMASQEVLVAVNTHGTETRGADVTVDATLHPPGCHLTFLYRSGWSDEQLTDPPADQTAPVHELNGRAFVRLVLPAAGMVILA
jgi:glycosidase